MIELTLFDGRRQYVAPSAIASVAETGASSQWHGVRAVVKLFDGTVIEVRDSAQEVMRSIQRFAQATGPKT